MVSPLWDPGQDWIQIFDKLLKHPQGPVRGCRCDMCQAGEERLQEGIPASLSSVTGLKAVSRRGSRASTEEREDDPGGDQTEASESGGVDEESFHRLFRATKQVPVPSAGSLTRQLASVTAALGSSEWRRRVEGLTLLRALVLAGAGEKDDFPTSLRYLQRPLVSCVQDLRSQVVKEACLTLAAIAQELGHRAEGGLEPLLPSLLGLLHSSAKVVSSSGVVCIRFLLQNCFCQGFIPVLCRGATSPSCCVKRHTFQFMEQVLHVWPLHRLAGQDHQVGEAIRLGLADMDPGTRSEARKAYWAFEDQFQLEAATLLSSMEARVASPERGRMSRQSSVARSQESVCAEEGGAGLTRRGSVRVRRNEEPGSSTLKRSSSAVDSTAARRAQVRMQYSENSRVQAAGLQRRGSLRRGEEGNPKFASPGTIRRGSRETDSHGALRKGFKESVSPESLQSRVMEPVNHQNSFGGILDFCAPGSKKRGTMDLGSPGPQKRESIKQVTPVILHKESAKPGAQGTIRKGSSPNPGLDSAGVQRAREVGSLRGKLAFLSKLTIGGQGKVPSSSFLDGRAAPIFGPNVQQRKSPSLSPDSPPTQIGSASTISTSKGSTPERSSPRRSPSPRLLCSPSPERSSGSPDSGISQDEVLLNTSSSRTLSLSRLAARVKEAEKGEEVVAALQLLGRLLEGSWGEEESRVVGQVARALVNAYEDTEASVRKAALGCLVSLCLQVGEDHLAAHLAPLAGARRKLLALHLHRARTGDRGR